MGLSRTGSRPFFVFLLLGFPYHPLKTRKGAFFARLLPGLGYLCRSFGGFGGFLGFRAWGVAGGIALVTQLTVTHSLPC